EIERASRRQLHRLVRALHQRAIDEAGGRAPDFLGRALYLVDEYFELSLEAGDRHLEFVFVGEDGHVSIRASAIPSPAIAVSVISVSSVVKFFSAERARSSRPARGQLRRACRL